MFFGPRSWSMTQRGHVDVAGPCPSGLLPCPIMIKTNPVLAGIARYAIDEVLADMDS